MENLGTLIVELPQFQHYYSPDLGVNAVVEFDKKYAIRSCVTVAIEENTSKRCTCGQYLLIRGNARRPLSDIEKKIIREDGEETDV